MKIFDFLRALFSSASRAEQIKTKQDTYNLRLANDVAFAEHAMQSPMHATIGGWIEINQGTKVLENGCGPGRYAAMLANLGFEVIGVDPVAFDTWTDLQECGALRFMSDTKAESLPFADGDFDAVCCLGALLYFDDPLMALKEMCRVLKPGGKLVLRTVNVENRFTKRTGKKLDPVSKNLYSKEELISLIESAGFSVKNHFFFGYWPTRFINFFWYLQNVFFTDEKIRVLSEKTPERSRVNHVVYAQKK